MKLRTVATLLLVPWALACSDAAPDAENSGNAGADEGSSPSKTDGDNSAPGEEGDPASASDDDPDASEGSGGNTAPGGTGGAAGTGGSSEPGGMAPGTITDGPLKMIWKATASVTINTGSGSFNYDVDWDGDGVFDDTGVTGSISHDYAQTGDHTVAIRGQFPHMIDNCAVEIIQWGNIKWASFRNTFDRCSGTLISAADVPDLSQVKDISFMFARSAVEFGPEAHLGDWDTSQVTTMSNVFRHASDFNEDVSGWDTSSATDMGNMFWKSFSFNHDISGWDTSQVTNMNNMFQHAREFNQALGTWDISQVSAMGSIFGTTKMDTANYDATLIGWASQSNLKAVELNATGRTYCEAADARDDLIAAGWTITGDTLQCD